MADNSLFDKVERGPDYSRAEASFIVEQVAQMDGLKNGSLRAKLKHVAARITDHSYDRYDIRLLDTFRKSSRVLEESGLLCRPLRTVIWQMRHDMWLDEYGEGRRS